MRTEQATLTVFFIIFHRKRSVGFFSWQVNVECACIKIVELCEAAIYHPLSEVSFPLVAAVYILRYDIFLREYRSLCADILLEHILHM